MTTKKNPLRKVITEGHRGKLADWIVESWVRPGPHSHLTSYWNMECGARLPIFSNVVPQAEVKAIISNISGVDPRFLSVSSSSPQEINISAPTSTGGRDYWRIVLPSGNLQAAQRQPNGLRAAFHRDRVMFRFNDDQYDPILAVFPDLKENRAGDVTCYAHIGQHSACSMEYVLNDTNPASPAEYAPLKKELERIGYNLDVIDPDRLPNGLRSGFLPKKVEWDSNWGVFAMPNWNPIREVKFSRVYPSHQDVEQEFFRHYGSKPQHIIFLDNDRIKVVYADIEFILTRLEFMDYTDPRKKNGLRAAFRGGDDSELHRWNVQTPEESWTHVFLPKNPTFAQIAAAIGRDSREVYDVRKKLMGAQIVVEFEDGDLYTLNRVW